MNQPSDEIKAKLDIVDVIREYIQLKAAGMNFRALCPFHREKTPSFMVSPEKQIWHCFGCFPKGSLIKTENGLTPIEKIKKGDYVISGKGNKKKVLLTMKRDYKGELVSVQTRKCNEIITMTADHEVYTLKTANCKQKSRETRLCQSRCKRNCPTKYFKEYKIEKIAANSLSNNDYLIYPIVEQIKDVPVINLNRYLNRRLTSYGPKIKKIPSKIKVNSDFLKLLGYYIAEGSNHRAYIRFSLGPHELDFAKDIQKLVKKVFGLNCGAHIRRKGKSGIEITCCNSNLSNIFRNLCGQGAENKHIPFAFSYLPFSKQRIILEAIFRGDGYRSKGSGKARPGERQISTISRISAHQIKDILLRLGFQPGLTYAAGRVDKKGVNHRESFTVRWREDLKGNYTDFYQFKNVKYWLQPIRKITKKKFRGEVYNLTIKDDHSYIANHFSVGNCGKGGDVISFVMEIEGLNFVEALRQLAPKAGITLRRQDPKAVSRRNRLLDIVDLSSKYYHKVLLESRDAEAARKYLSRRGLKEETIEEWRVGYSPDSWDDLIKFLVGRGYKEQEIFLAGMSVKKESASRFYNRFRGRIMFPIYDVNGSAVAFSARVNPENEEGEKMGKYINSPQTPIYDKSNILFGLDKAKLEIKKQDLAVVVEGQMDVITAHQNGFANVVASSGTALTKEQIVLLKRYSNNLCLAFDPDAAGEMAADRGIREAMRAEMNVKVIELPAGQDPDDCIRNNPKEWAQAVEGAKPMMRYYFDKTFAALDADNIEDKRRAVQKLLPLLNKLGSMIEQDFWLKKLSEIIDIKESILRETLLKLGPDKDRGKEEAEQPAAAVAAKKTREEMLSELMLAFVFKFPQFTDYIINNIQPDQIVGLDSQTLYRKLVIYYNNIIDNRAETAGEGGNPSVKYEDFRIWLSNPENYNSDARSEEIASQMKLLDKLVILGDKDFYDYDGVQAKNEVIKIIINLKKHYLSARKKEVEKLIAQAEGENDRENIRGLMEEFKALSEELRELDN